MRPSAIWGTSWSCIWLERPPDRLCLHRRLPRRAVRQGRWAGTTVYPRRPSPSECVRARRVARRSLRPRGGRGLIPIRPAAVFVRQKGLRWRGVRGRQRVFPERWGATSTMAPGPLCWKRRSVLAPSAGLGAWEGGRRCAFPSAGFFNRRRLRYRQTSGTPRRDSDTSQPALRACGSLDVEDWRGGDEYCRASVAVGMKYALAG
jgi:hypothetical protein